MLWYVCRVTEKPRRPTAPHAVHPWTSNNDLATSHHPVQTALQYDRAMSNEISNRIALPSRRVQKDVCAVVTRSRLLVPPRRSLLQLLSFGSPDPGGSLSFSSSLGFAFFLNPTFFILLYFRNLRLFRSHRL